MFRPKYTIAIYTDKNGNKPFLVWLNSITDSNTKRLIRHRMDRVEQGNFGDYKPLGGNLFELRFLHKQGYRIYFAIEENTVVILFSGGSKSTQEKDILKARALLKDYKGENHD